MRVEVGLTISVGVSFNRAFAKLGSDYKKPDGTTVFSRGNYKDKVWPLPVSALLYVGRHALDKLSRPGVHTIGDLACATRVPARRFSGKWATPLLLRPRGGRRAGAPFTRSARSNPWGTA